MEARNSIIDLQASGFVRKRSEGSGNLIGIISFRIIRFFGFPRVIIVSIMIIVETGFGNIWIIRISFCEVFGSLSCISSRDDTANTDRGSRRKSNHSDAGKRFKNNTHIKPPPY